jgi:uncharacterized damage-inducible protein DinB
MTLVDPQSTILGAWETNNLVTTRLVEQLPTPLWDAPIPGLPRRTARSIAAHLHNARSRWLRTLGKEHGLAAPPLDVGHVLAYFVAHEGHHRGQIVMIAQQLGHRLPVEVTGGLWQWTARVREWTRAR